jgi:hypothetical protein
MDGPLWTGFLCLQCIREKEVGVVEDLGEVLAGSNSIFSKKFGSLKTGSFLF